MRRVWPPPVLARSTGSAPLTIIQVTFGTKSGHAANIGVRESGRPDFTNLEAHLVDIYETEFP